jgi:hypothetical protein
MSRSILGKGNATVTQIKHTLLLGNCCVVGHLIHEGKPSSDSEETNLTLYVAVTLTTLGEKPL